MDKSNISLVDLALQSVMTTMPLLNRTYNMPYHLQPIVNVYNRILRGEQVKVCIAAPPRHFKTETGLGFMSMYINKYRKHNICFLGHTQDFAASKVLTAQKYAKSLGVIGDPQMQNRKEWRTSEGGALMANGINGNIMGVGFNVALVDDPIKSRAEAESLTYRKKTWAAFDDVETRLEPNASVVVTMTRWHTDDLIGRILRERKGYEFIRIPALCDDINDLLGRELGEALCPYRYSKERLEEIKDDKPYTFSSLYQGLPQIKGSNLFKEPTFYDKLPNSYIIRIGADLAYSDKTTSDYSTVVVTAESENIFYILHVERWQTEISESLKKLKSIQSKYNVPINLEANGPQKGIFDFVKKQLNVSKARVTGDKYVRALPVIEKWNSGLIRVPLHASWLNTYLEEIVNFTGVKDLHDDMVDATVYSIKEPMNVHVNN